MRALLILTLATPLMLGGCASLARLSGGGADGDAAAALLANLRGCERSYIGTLGGLAPPAASLSIRCAADFSAQPLSPDVQAVIRAEVARALGVAPADITPAEGP
jgi:hypothetical protein